MSPRNEAIVKSSKLFQSFKSKGGDGIKSLRSSANSTDSFPADSPTNSFGGGMMMSTADIAALVAGDYDSDEKYEEEERSEACTSGIGDSDGEDSDDDDTGSVKDLDGSMGSRKHVLDSNALLARLGPSPTPEEIASLAAAKAQEYIIECFDDDSSTLDKEKFEAIPQYVKSDLVIGQFLGKGSFSDAFEVTLTAKPQRSSAKPFSEDNGDSEDLDAMIAMAANQFGGQDGSGTNGGETFRPMQRNGSMDLVRPNPRRAPRRASNQFSKSVCMGTIVQNAPAITEIRMTLAMKCLRPQIRASAEQFLIGVEDLIHETAMLASLDHPNIIKIHGRSGGSVADSFKLSDGYFILLDRLTDTLDTRIARWKKNPLAGKKGPSVNQVRVASSLADAVLFLHRNNIVFRDLKPANVGFDSRGVLKLFDFGFAVSVDEDNPNALFDKCGTLRYMAPEVGLGVGYGLAADIYSVGMLLWEICALKKPFSKVKTAAAFEKLVFKEDTRPKIGKKWAQPLKGLISQCWSKNPEERPSMSVVKSTLAAYAEELSRSRPASLNSLGKSMKMSMRRLTT